jgi:hypothetical protein
LKLRVAGSKASMVDWPGIGQIPLSPTE